MNRRGTKTEVARELMAGPKDIVKTHNIKLELVDWTSDLDEPAYDVNVTVDGKPVEGGARCVFSVGDAYPSAALRKANTFMDYLVKSLVEGTGGKLRA